MSSRGIHKLEWGFLSKCQRILKRVKREQGRQKDNDKTEMETTQGDAAYVKVQSAKGQRTRSVTDCPHGAIRRPWTCSCFWRWQVDVKSRPMRVLQFRESCHWNLLYSFFGLAQFVYCGHNYRAEIVWRKWFRIPSDVTEIVHMILNKTSCVKTKVNK